VGAAHYPGTCQAGVLQVHMLDGDPPGIKEKKDASVSEDDLKSTCGIAKLLEFFESIYEKDSLSLKKKGKSIQESIPEWTKVYKKAKNIGFRVAGCSQSFTT
jgi:hypothetical protein